MQPLNVNNVEHDAHFAYIFWVGVIIVIITPLSIAYN